MRSENGGYVEVGNKTLRLINVIIFTLFSLFIGWVFIFLSIGFTLKVHKITTAPPILIIIIGVLYTGLCIYIARLIYKKNMKRGLAFKDNFIFIEAPKGTIKTKKELIKSISKYQFFKRTVFKVSLGKVKYYFYIKKPQKIEAHINSSGIKYSQSNLFSRRLVSMLLVIASIIMVKAFPGNRVLVFIPPLTLCVLLFLGELFYRWGVSTLKIDRLIAVLVIPVILAYFTAYMSTGELRKFSTPHEHDH